MTEPVVPNSMLKVGSGTCQCSEFVVENEIGEHMVSLLVSWGPWGSLGIPEDVPGGPMGIPEDVPGGPLGIPGRTWGVPGGP